MLRPGSTYAGAAAATSDGGWWILLRGPLSIALAIACLISILTRGYLAPGLVAGGVIAWSFVPLAEVAGLAVVWRGRRSEITFATAVDLFFAGHAPLLLWLLASVIFWHSVDPQPPEIFRAWGLSLVPITAWSGYVDFQFLRHVAGMKRPGWCLFVQRAVCWTLFVAVFGGVSLWPGLLEELGVR